MTICSPKIRAEKDQYEERKFLKYEGRLESLWTPLITLIWNYVEMR